MSVRLEVRRRGLFSGLFSLHDQGWPAGELRTSFLKEWAELRAKEGMYILRRERRFRGRFLLECGAEVLAHAEKPSIFRSELRLERDGQQYILKQASFFARRYVVRQDGHEVGTIEPKGLVPGAADVHLPAEWTLAERVFVYWLVLVMQKRKAASAG